MTVYRFCTYGNVSVDKTRKYVSLFDNDHDIKYITYKEFSSHGS